MINPYHVRKDKHPIINPSTNNKAMRIMAMVMMMMFAKDLKDE